MINYIMTYRQERCRHILFRFSGPEKKAQKTDYLFWPEDSHELDKYKTQNGYLFLLRSKMQFPDVWQKTWLLLPLPTAKPWTNCAVSSKCRQSTILHSCHLHCSFLSGWLNMNI